MYRHSTASTSSYTAPAALFLAFVLLFLTCISIPFAQGIRLFTLVDDFTGGSIRFGLWGYCLGESRDNYPVCTKPELGWNFDNIPTLTGLENSLSSRLTNSLLIHPLVTAGVFVIFIITIALALNLSSRRKSGTKLRRSSLDYAPFVLALVAAILTTAASIIDLIIILDVKTQVRQATGTVSNMKAHTGAIPWLSCVAMIILWASLIMLYFLQRDRKTHDRNLSDDVYESDSSISQRDTGLLSSRSPYDRRLSDYPSDNRTISKSDDDRYDSGLRSRTGYGSRSHVARSRSATFSGSRSSYEDEYSQRKKPGFLVACCPCFGRDKDKEKDDDIELSSMNDARSIRASESYRNSSDDLRRRTSRNTTDYGGDNIQDADITSRYSRSTNGGIIPLAYSREPSSRIDSPTDEELSNPYSSSSPGAERGRDLSDSMSDTRLRSRNGLDEGVYTPRGSFSGTYPDDRRDLSASSDYSNPALVGAAGYRETSRPYSRSSGLVDTTPGARSKYETDSYSREPSLDRLRGGDSADSNSYRAEYDGRRGALSDTPYSDHSSTLVEGGGVYPRTESRYTTEGLPGRSRSVGPPFSDRVTSGYDPRGTALGGRAITSSDSYTIDRRRDDTDSRPLTYAEGGSTQVGNREFSSSDPEDGYGGRSAYRNTTDMRDSLPYSSSSDREASEESRRSGGMAFATSMDPSIDSRREYASRYSAMSRDHSGSRSTYQDGVGRGPTARSDYRSSGEEYDSSLLSSAGQGARRDMTRSDLLTPDMERNTRAPYLSPVGDQRSLDEVIDGQRDSRSYTGLRGGGFDDNRTALSSVTRSRDASQYSTTPSDYSRSSSSYGRDGAGREPTTRSDYRSNLAPVNSSGAEYDRSLSSIDDQGSREDDFTDQRESRPYTGLRGGGYPDTGSTLSSVRSLLDEKNGSVTGDLTPQSSDGNRYTDDPRYSSPPPPYSDDRPVTRAVSGLSDTYANRSMSDSYRGDDNITPPTTDYSGMGTAGTRVSERSLPERELTYSTSVTDPRASSAYPQRNTMNGAITSAESYGTGTTSLELSGGEKVASGPASRFPYGEGSTESGSYASSPYSETYSGSGDRDFVGLAAPVLSRSRTSRELSYPEKDAGRVYDEDRRTSKMPVSGRSSSLVSSYDRQSGEEQSIDSLPYSPSRKTEPQRLDSQFSEARPPYSPRDESTESYVDSSPVTSPRYSRMDDAPRSYIHDVSSDDEGDGTWEPSTNPSTSRTHSTYTDTGVTSAETYSSRATSYEGPTEDDRYELSPPTDAYSRSGDRNIANTEVPLSRSVNTGPSASRESPFYEAGGRGTSYGDEGRRTTDLTGRRTSSYDLEDDERSISTRPYSKSITQLPSNQTSELTAPYSPHNNESAMTSVDGLSPTSPVYSLMGNASPRASRGLSSGSSYISTNDEDEREEVPIAKPSTSIYSESRSLGDTGLSTSGSYGSRSRSYEPSDGVGVAAVGTGTHTSQPDSSYVRSQTPPYMTSSTPHSPRMSTRLSESYHPEPSLSQRFDRALPPGRNSTSQDIRSTRSSSYVPSYGYNRSYPPSPSHSESDSRLVTGAVTGAPDTSIPRRTTYFEDNNRSPTASSGYSGTDFMAAAAPALGRDTLERGTRYSSIDGESSVLGSPVSNGPGNGPGDRGTLGSLYGDEDRITPASDSSEQYTRSPPYSPRQSQRTDGDPAPVAAMGAGYTSVPRSSSSPYGSRMLDNDVALSSPGYSRGRVASPTPRNYIPGGRSEYDSEGKGMQPPPINSPFTPGSFTSSGGADPVLSSPGSYSLGPSPYGMSGRDGTPAGERFTSQPNTGYGGGLSRPYSPEMSTGDSERYASQRSPGYSRDRMRLSESDPQDVFSGQRSSYVPSGNQKYANSPPNSVSDGRQATGMGMGAPYTSAPSPRSYDDEDITSTLASPGYPGAGVSAMRPSERDSPERRTRYNSIDGESSVSGSPVSNGPGDRRTLGSLYGDENGITPASDSSERGVGMVHSPGSYDDGGMASTLASPGYPGTGVAAMRASGLDSPERRTPYSSINGESSALGSPVSNGPGNGNRGTLGSLYGNENRITPASDSSEQYTRSPPYSPRQSQRTDGDPAPVAAMGAGYTSVPRSSSSPYGSRILDNDVALSSPGYSRGSVASPTPRNYIPGGRSEYDSEGKGMQPPPINSPFTPGSFTSSGGADPVLSSPGSYSLGPSPYGMSGRDGTPAGERFTSQPNTGYGGGLSRPYSSEMSTGDSERYTPEHSQVQSPGYNTNRMRFSEPGPQDIFSGRSSSCDPLGDRQHTYNTPYSPRSSYDGRQVTGTGHSPGSYDDDGMTSTLTSPGYPGAGVGATQASEHYAPDQGSRYISTDDDYNGVPITNPGAYPSDGYSSQGSYISESPFNQERYNTGSGRVAPMPAPGALSSGDYDEYTGRSNSDAAPFYGRGTGQQYSPSRQSSLDPYTNEQGAIGAEPYDTRGDDFDALSRPMESTIYPKPAHSGVIPSEDNTSSSLPSGYYDGADPDAGWTQHKTNQDSVDSILGRDPYGKESVSSGEYGPRMADDNTASSLESVSDHICSSEDDGISAGILGLHEPLSRSEDGGKDDYFRGEHIRRICENCGAYIY